MLVAFFWGGVTSAWAAAGQCPTTPQNWDAATCNGVCTYDGGSDTWTCDVSSATTGGMAVVVYYASSGTPPVHYSGWGDIDGTLFCCNTQNDDPHHFVILGSPYDDDLGFHWGAGDNLSPSGTAITGEVDAGDGLDAVYGSDQVANYSETLYGDADEDDIYGGGDADTIYGGTEDDTCDGGTEADFINGGDGADTIHGAAGIDTIHGDADGDFLYGDADGDLMYGDGEADEMYGGINGDVMLGNDGEDIMRGDPGTDAMYGGAGDDAMSGRDDNDTMDGGTEDDTLCGDNQLGGGDTLDDGDSQAGVDLLWSAINVDFVVCHNTSTQYDCAATVTGTCSATCLTGQPAACP